jgi:hypothetical protein
MYGPPNCYTKFDHEKSLCKDGSKKFKRLSESGSLRIVGSVQKAVTDTIKTLTDADFHCCEAWKIQWIKRVASEGYYFEGDNVNLDE